MKNAPIGGASVEAGVLCESWDYPESDTQYLTHNIHRYSGKFIPQIASRAVELLTRPGELVVDPFCGSGTTLLECAQRHRRAVGVDLNPLAVLIAKVKTTPVPSALLDKLVCMLRGELSTLGGGGGFPLFEASDESSDADARHDARLSHEWYRKWFQPHVLLDLIRIDRAVARISEEPLRNIALVAFSDILRRSSNAHSGYPNVMFDKNAPEKSAPIRPFLKALERIAGMVATLSGVDAEWSGVRVVHGNAGELPFDDATVDAVVSHPPYIGSIPYAEYGALSLQWLGTDPRQLDGDLTGGRRQSSRVVARFEDGYGKMLQESARVLKPGRHAFVMVGNPVVRGEVIDLAAMTLSLASKAGLELVARTERRGVNRRANKMGAEHLLFLQKAPSRGVGPEAGC